MGGGAPVGGGVPGRLPARSHPGREGWGSVFSLGHRLSEVRVPLGDPQAASRLCEPGRPVEDHAPQGRSGSTIAVSVVPALVDEDEHGAPEGVVPSQVSDGGLPFGWRPAWAYSIWSRSMGGEQVREALGVPLQPVQADERFIHVAHLVLAVVVLGREARPVSLGGLHEGAQGIPQGITDGLVVDVIPARRRPDRDLRPDVIRQGGSKGFLRSALGDLAVLVQERTPWPSRS